MNASLSNAFRAIARRPATVVILLGFAGFLIDFWVRPISLAGLVLLLLAASPFVLRMIRGEALDHADAAPVAKAAEAPAPAAQPQVQRAPVPAAAAPQPVRPRVARPAEPERVAREARATSMAEAGANARNPAQRIPPRFEEPTRVQRQRSPSATAAE